MPLIRTLLGIVVLQALVIVFNICRAKWVSVVLGPQGLGIVGTIDQFLPVVFQVSTLSLPTVALKFLSRAHSDGIEVFRHTYASFLKALLGLALGGAVLAVVAVSVRPDMLGADLASHQIELTLALGFVPIMAVALLLSSVLAASQRPMGAAAIQSGLAAVLAIAAAVGLSVGGIREIYVAGLVLGLALIGFLLTYLHRMMQLPFFDDTTSIRRELQQSPGIVASTLMAYVSLSVYSISLLAPRYAVLRNMGAESAGLLQSVLSLTAAVGALMAAMNAQYLMPTLNRRSAVAEKLEAAGLFQRHQLMLLAGAGAPLVLFPETALSVLFSSRFIDAAPWLAAFLVWQLLVMQASILQQVLFSIDALKPMAAVTCVGYGTATVLCFVLTPIHGWAGVAAALLAGSLLIVLLCGWYLHRHHGFALQGRAVGLVSYVVVAFLAVGFIVRAFVDVGLPDLMARGMVGVLFFAGLACFVDRSERASLTAAARRVLKSA